MSYAVPIASLLIQSLPTVKYFHFTFVCQNGDLEADSQNFATGDWNIAFFTKMIDYEIGNVY